MTDIPHFDIPFRFGSDGHAVTVEQDSEDDIFNCVSAIVRTTAGSREDIPEFGIADLTFGKIPLDTAVVQEDILAQEPRAFVLVEQAPDRFSYLAQNVLVSVAVRDPGEVSSV